MSILQQMREACRQLLPLLSPEPAVLGSLCQLALLLGQVASSADADQEKLQVGLCAASHSSQDDRVTVEYGVAACEHVAKLT